MHSQKWWELVAKSSRRPAVESRSTCVKTLQWQSELWVDQKGPQRSEEERKPKFGPATSKLRNGLTQRATQNQRFARHQHLPRSESCSRRNNQRAHWLSSSPTKAIARQARPLKRVLGLRLNQPNSDRRWRLRRLRLLPRCHRRLHSQNETRQNETSQRQCNSTR